MERREVRSQEEQRLRVRRRFRLAGIGAIGLVVVAVLAVGFWFAFLQPRPGESVSTSGASDHSGVPSGGYSTSPPTSGSHSPEAPPWGEHRGGLSEILQVHGLEHGGVLVQYNCPDGCSNLISDLRSITEGYDTQVILAPYTNMESLIALTSWGKIDLLDEFEGERIEEFVDKNRRRAPEDRP